jgi:hypothetical protein
MSDQSLDENDAKKMFANPYYAIVIAESLNKEHEPIIAEEDWVKVNVKLINEIGAEEWLHRLLDVLKGN